METGNRGEIIDDLKQWIGILESGRDDLGSQVEEMKQKNEALEREKAQYMLSIEDLEAKLQRLLDEPKIQKIIRKRHIELD